MTTLFANVLKQAFKTFDRSNQPTFLTNFILLKQLTEQLTFRDINLSAEFFSEILFSRPGKAPCTFVHVFENSDVSMSVFVMRAGYTMPLHDHPMMHGMLKCFYGKLLINSYTQKLPPDSTPFCGDAMQPVSVSLEGPRIVTPESECAILTPIERNFHEITAIDGVAAFFDILSPPYDSDIPIFGRRKCKFYRKIVCPHDEPSLPNQCNKSSIWLERIPTPLSYYCDTADVSESVTECCSSVDCSPK